VPNAKYEADRTICNCAYFREMSAKSKAAVKELATNVAKALSKKVDRADLKRLMREENAEAAGGGGGGAAALISRSEPPPSAAREALAAPLLSEATSKWASQEQLHLIEEHNSLRSQLGAMEQNLDSLRSQVSSLQSAVRSGIAGGKIARPRGPSGPARDEEHSQIEDYSSASVRADVALGWDAARSRSAAGPIPGAEKADSFVGVNPNALLMTSLNNVDWRIALGELGMGLRRELQDKASREEMHSVVNAEFEKLSKRFTVRGSMIHSYYDENATEGNMKAQ
jgi:hypothetical protein